MTPAARHQAAITCLDDIAAGAAPEQVLTQWARTNRYAGSKDRAAVRDIVFAVVRRWRSTAWLGGGEGGRAQVLGLLRALGQSVEAVFDGSRYGPAPLAEGEGQVPLGSPADAVALDLPDWIWDQLISDLGPDQARAQAQALQERAPVFLRVNTARSATDQVSAALAAEGIETRPVPGIPTALRVEHGARRVAQSAPYADGVVELQDASGQAAVLALPDMDGARVLDLCAGGGGKALALAARGAQVTASDVDLRRMADLPQRATRAGAAIEIAAAGDLANGYDGVVLDVPCSGSGTWRRAPQGKWALSPARLDHLHQTQAQLLDQALHYLRPGGWIGYMTCSLLRSENDDQVAAALTRHPHLRADGPHHWAVSDQGDGFFQAVIWT